MYTVLLRRDPVSRNPEQRRASKQAFFLVFICAGAFFASLADIGVPVTGCAGVFFQLHSMRSPVLSSGRVPGRRIVASIGFRLVLDPCAFCIHQLAKEWFAPGFVGENLRLVLHALHDFNPVFNSGTFLLQLASQRGQDHAVPS